MRLGCPRKYYACLIISSLLFLKHEIFNLLKKRKWIIVLCTSLKVYRTISILFLVFKQRLILEMGYLKFLITLFALSTYQFHE